MESTDQKKTSPKTTPSKTTPLDALHARLEARMTPFAGYSMPLQYPPGVLKEHNHCRSAAGLFDVSHMGQVVLRARSGKTADAAAAVERLVPVDVQGLTEGRQRYGLFTNDKGGLIDDLMIANRGDHLFLVVNASRKDIDLEHMRTHLTSDCEIEVLEDRALIALQGPRAAEVLKPLAPATDEMRFMDVISTEILGAACVVSRSGYTGEDGFEISVPAARAEAVADTLLAHEAVQPIGLGARDSLRIEAGLCLYGNDIDETTTPIEAGLVWAIQKVRRRGGARAGGFPGAEIILDQIESGVSRRRVGLSPEGRAPIRAGAPILSGASDQIGQVTSGVFGPSVEGPVAMGYVKTGAAKAGTQVFAEVRGKHLPVTVTDLPFITPGYKR